MSEERRDLGKDVRAAIGVMRHNLAEVEKAAEEEGDYERAMAVFAILEDDAATTAESLAFLLGAEDTLADMRAFIRSEVHGDSPEEIAHFLEEKRRERGPRG